MAVGADIGPNNCKNLLFGLKLSADNQGSVALFIDARLARGVLEAKFGRFVGRVSKGIFVVLPWNVRARCLRIRELKAVIKQLLPIMNSRGFEIQIKSFSVGQTFSSITQFFSCGESTNDDILCSHS